MRDEGETLVRLGLQGFRGHFHDFDLCPVRIVRPEHEALRLSSFDLRIQRPAGIQNRFIGMLNIFRHQAEVYL